MAPLPGLSLCPLYPVSHLTWGSHHLLQGLWGHPALLLPTLLLGGPVLALGTPSHVQIPACAPGSGAAGRGMSKSTSPSCVLCTSPAPPGATSGPTCQPAGDEAGGLGCSSKGGSDWLRPGIRPIGASPRRPAPCSHLSSNGWGQKCPSFESPALVDGC